MPPKKKPAKEEPKKKKPRDALDYATDLISPALNFAKGNFKELFIKYLKVDIVSGLVGLALLILFGLVTIGFAVLMGAPLTDIPSFVIFLSGHIVLSVILVIWLFISMFIIGWIVQSIELTKFLITKEQFLGKYSGIWPLFNRILYPVLSLMLLSLGIGIVVFGIPGLILFLLSGQNMAFWIAFVLFMILLLLFMIIFNFLSQFWKWEVVVGEKPALEALKSSMNICWKNVIGVFVFDILLFIAAIIIAIPFIGVEFVSEIFINLALLPSMFTSAGMVVWVAVFGLYILFRVLLNILRQVVINIVILPYVYSFWAKIRQKSMP